MTEHGFTVSVKNVAELLKCIVNNQCKEGFRWFPEAKGAAPSIYEICSAIEILEDVPDKNIRIKTDDDLGPYTTPRRVL